MLIRNIFILAAIAIQLHSGDIFWHITFGTPESLGKFIEKPESPSINSSNNEGKTPLGAALDAKNCNIETISVLLANQADPNMPTRHTTSEVFPLHLAAAKGHCAIIQALLNARACIEARDSETQTPLVYAVQSQQSDALKALLDYNADPVAKIQSRDVFQEHETALDRAMRCELENAEVITIALIRDAGYVEPEDTPVSSWHVPDQ